MNETPSQIGGPDQLTKHICDQLQIVVNGMVALGQHPHLISRAIDKLRTQDAEIVRLTSDRAYLVGHKEGWEAAMATGLPQDTETSGE